jgi:hypothetical protein
MKQHNAEPGPLTRCQITGSENLNLILDLGNQPPCDSLGSTLNKPETHYPLALYHCPDSGLAQLDYVVGGSEIYPPEYPYRSGISKPLEEYQRGFAERVVERFNDSRPNPLVVDIGSNDGTLLTGFKAKGWRALGVEPTDVAAIAREENGIATLQEFFNEEVAKNITSMYGSPLVVVMTNVFAHMAELGDVMDGICHLLSDPKAVFITESHYLLDVLEKNQFDTIYHEHIRTYSLKALCTLAGMYGLEVFDVERGSRYGGNIRVYIARQGLREVMPSVELLLQEEESKGLHTREAWAAWRSRVHEQRDRMMEFLYHAKVSGLSIAGCSAPGRAATLANFYGIKRELVPYTGELHNSLKLNKFMPGCHILVRDNKCLVEEQPDYIILFAWHYAEEISRRLRAEGIRSTLLQPLPYFRIFHPV